MSGPRTSREALIAEVLGDLGRLIDQAQALVPVMVEARRSLSDASDQLLRAADTHATSFETRIDSISERAKSQVVKHVVEKANEAYRRKIGEQEKQARDAIRALLAAEIDLATKRVKTAQHGVPTRDSRALEAALTHLAVAVVASGLTWAVLSWLAAK